MSRSRPPSHDALRAKLAPLYDGTRCPRCGRTMSDDVPVGHPNKLTMDHIIPHSLGGPSIESNVVFVCNRCNSSRGARAIPSKSRVLYDDW